MNQPITVLRTLGPLVAKTWLADNTIQPYDNPRRFAVSTVACNGPLDLFKLLLDLAGQPSKCVIRGKLRHGVDASLPIERNLQTFEDQPSNLLVLDVDGYPLMGPPGPACDAEAAVRLYVEHELPPCFQGITYTYHFSGSMGHPSKAGTLRCHLYFWLAHPLSCSQAEVWGRTYLPQVDHTVHRVVQINYTADPVMHGSMVDPYAGRRVGLVRGLLDDELTLPDDMPLPPEAELRTPAGRRNMVDPRDKPGVVGAVCRAFKPEQIVQLFPEHFVEGGTAKRITWLGGGGTPEGVVVTDDGLHLFNSHHTAPVQTAANLFDFLRHHLYGHLDEAIEPELAMLMGPSWMPSHKSVAEWALAQPEVQEELGEDAEAERVEKRQDAKAADLIEKTEDRAARLERVLRLIEKASADRLELELCREIAKAKWTDIERQILTNAVQARATVLSGGKKVPVAHVRRWLAPSVAEAVFSHLNDQGKPSLTAENLAALLARKGWTPRYDVISKRQEILGAAEGSLRDNRNNVALGRVISACGEVGIAQALAHIKAFLCILCDENPYNPVLSWVEARPWDGRSRLPELLATMELHPDQDVALAALILRKWLIQCIAVAASPVPLQARGVLAFSGPQYIGKSRWLQRLCHGGPEGLVATGRLIDPHQKDTILQAIPFWIVEMGELDATMKKADQAGLKAFLAQDTDTVRPAYAPDAMEYQRRTSFAATVNGDGFLNDETGNTRFWTLQVLSMQPDHGVDMQQVWAELYAAWQAGETHHFTMPEMQRVSADSEKHQARSPLMDRLEDGFQWPQRVPGADTLTPMTPQEAINQGWQKVSVTRACELAGHRVMNASERSRATAWLKKLGAVKAQRGAEERGWWVPRVTGFDGGDA